MSFLSRLIDSVSGHHSAGTYFYPLAPYQNFGIGVMDRAFTTGHLPPNQEYTGAMPASWVQVEGQIFMTERAADTFVKPDTAFDITGGAQLANSYDLLGLLNNPYQEPG